MWVLFKYCDKVVVKFFVEGIFVYVNKVCYELFLVYIFYRVIMFIEIIIFCFSEIDVLGYINNIVFFVWFEVV